MAFDSFAGIIKAARAGRGVARVPVLVASKAVATGHLQRIGRVEIQSGSDDRLMAASRITAARRRAPLAKKVPAILAEDFFECRVSN